MAEVLKQIREWLASSGFEIGAHGTCSHTCRLPPSVLVKPGYSPVNGAYGLLVTATEVLSATYFYPSNYNDWQIWRRIPYGSRDELKRILGELIVQPRGCWATSGCGSSGAEHAATVD